MDTLFPEDHEYLDGMKEIVEVNVTAAMWCDMENPIYLGSS